MKERSKLFRSKKNKKKHEVSQRLSSGLDKDEEVKMDIDQVTKRRKEYERPPASMLMTGKTPAKH
jgi:hypothetical protein